MTYPPPELSVVEGIARAYFKDFIFLERTATGASTYVYRTLTSGGVRYIRLLPEGTSFAPEVLAHRILLALGVPVPEVLGWEARNQATGLSVMVTEAMPGRSVQEEPPAGGTGPVLMQAGRQLARLHQVPVAGFGFIDRAHGDALRGEYPDFSSFWDAHLAADLEALDGYPFSARQRADIAAHLARARPLLDTPRAVLAHGDFDISHIFHQNGRLTGFIDLGEIRGCSPLFDLGTFCFADATPGRIAYEHLLTGYSQVHPLRRDDRYAAACMGLFQIVRFLGKKAGAPAAAFWRGQALRQLDYLSGL